VSASTGSLTPGARIFRDGDRRTVLPRCNNPHQLDDDVTGWLVDDTTSQPALSAGPALVANRGDIPAMKNALHYTILVIFCALSVPEFTPGPAAAQSDTLVVQTFTFADIETRRATFEFPTADRSWQRILMHYTLKCDDATVGDPYPCGEWDVTTQTMVHVHTGQMDSTLLSHPYFTVEGESPETFSYSEEPRYHYFTAWSDPDPLHDEGRDHYLRFAGTDCITVPPAALATVDSSLTISFWMRGDASQPHNDHIVEAGERGGRVINIHLPWGTGTVYWDAGGRLGGNNNRLSKQADPGAFKGRWNHWAFTKDARTGEMAIYLNGELWHRAGSMVKDIQPIDAFTIGANLYRSGGWYAGDLDEVRVWDLALDGETIADWRQRPISAEHPDYAHLLVEYRFDDVGGFDGADSAEEKNLVLDSSPHAHHGTCFGQPQRRPHGLRGRADTKPGARAVLHTDSIPAPRISVQLFENEDEPETVTRVLDVWPAHDSWFDSDGNLLSEKPIDEPTVLEQKTWTWYGEPFEKIETYELARFITPYGKRLDLGETGFTWIDDVTDYAPLLRGTVDLQAGNTLELLDLKFVFVAGTPPREVQRVENLWPVGNHSYRDLADDVKLQPVVLQADADAAGFRVRSRISGHGHAGPHNCCEWDAKDHLLLVGGIERFRWNVWRDCGMNPVHPQGGTWQFDRAGWCPGTFVDTYDHELTPWLAPGEQVALDYAPEPYDPDNGEADGYFVVAHQLFTYGPPSFERDAAVVDVIAPSAHGEYRRLNPVSGEASVRIRNLGAETLRSLRIEYGLDAPRGDGAEEDGENTGRGSFDWSGELAFLATETITLPPPDWSGMDADSRFTVTLSKPNGKDDQQRSNDRLTVPVAAPHLLPAEFLIEVKMPGFGRAADNSYTITDRGGRVVASRDQFDDNATYRDRIRLEPGAYVFEFLDTEEDGLIRHWWLRGSEPEKMGENGALKILDAEGEVLLDLGYDFAEKRALRFFVGEVR